MKALIVRPQPAAEELYEALKHIGVASTCCPVVSFQGTPLSRTTTQHLLSSDIIIAVSQPAVQYAEHFIHQQRLTWPSTCTYYAVGEKTAAILQSFCKTTVQYPKNNDSEGLLVLLSSPNLSGKKITILRGDSGREHLMESLITMKANVQYAQTYQRIWQKFSATTKIKEWQTDKIDTLIVTSFEQLKFFVQQIPSEHENWLHSLFLMVPSQRIVQLATQLGFQNIRNLDSATNNSIIHAIKGELKRKIV